MCMHMCLVHLCTYMRACMHACMDRLAKSIEASTALCGHGLGDEHDVKNARIAG